MPRASEESSLSVYPLKLGMGQFQVLRHEGSLRTLLGSCIGLVLHDAHNRVGGMAHIVLPTSSGPDQPLGKFANTAVPELIRLIALSGGRPINLSAKLAGGANMFGTSNRNSIGDQNLAMVERLLNERSIPVVGRHCGGQQGRRMSYDVTTGNVLVELVGGEAIAL